MTKAPERICAAVHMNDENTHHQEWLEPIDAMFPRTEYVRADIHEAVIAERDEMAAALDSHHASVGHNIWRFWSDKAREMADRVKDVQAERDALRQALEWQPIETAPKDGTRVLVWSPVDKTAFACGFDCGQWQTGVWRARINKAPVTHWMPLPDPPEDT